MSSVEDYINIIRLLRSTLSNLNYDNDDQRDLLYIHGYCPYCYCSLNNHICPEDDNDDEKSIQSTDSEED